ncbi:hypothetical protein E1B28_002951 [Marasmius oreades]|uniref:PMS1 n=1 Tax=Marasmius oreades TaxID=181124 RepID=A0A9P7RLJ5_9AGAR|nr:uncharacterized protein E1B28_002951 [Marasmius oreades]KAG7085388.1 hypothetical protein E1B28_002951 [Marasmius oreades]
MSEAPGNTKSIKAIDAKSVHQITSGQVVIDLQTAVKELVENSLDAGATSVEVRFKNYGLNSVEVIDNGSGIPESDFEDIGRKHHTSKLSSFEDLTSITSFGFRGEAMSSLCALCESVTVTTAVAGKAPMGTVLELGKDGGVMKRGKAPRQRGTTVLLTTPFVSLPVRRKELERNIKREFGKTLTLLNAYALGPCCGLNAGSSYEDASENDFRTRAVRLVVTNQPDKGQKVTCISLPLPSPAGTPPSVRNGVNVLWGSKALGNVIDFSFQFQVPRISVKRYKRKVDTDDEKEETFVVRVKGLISSPVPIPGSNSNSRFARTAADRQFFYINGRPCTLPKAQKALNETYRSYTASNSAIPHFPLVIMDFNLPGDAVDVNVTPDKRTIVVHAETHIVDGLRNALDELFSPTRSTYGVNNTQCSDTTKGLPQSSSTVNPTPHRTVSMPPPTIDSDQGESDKDIPRERIVGKLERSRTACTTLQGQAGSSNAAATARLSSGSTCADRRTPSSPTLNFRTRCSASSDLQIASTPSSGEGLGLRDSPASPPSLPPHGADAVISKRQEVILAGGSTEKKKKKKNAGEVVVSTADASWMEKVGSSAQKDVSLVEDRSEPRAESGDDEPPRKKRKSIAINADPSDEDIEVLDTCSGDGQSSAKARKNDSIRQRQLRLTDTSQPRNARQSMRSRLASFARAGSLIPAPPPEEDDQEGRDQEQEDDDGNGMRVGDSIATDSSLGSSSQPLPLFLPDEDGDTPMEDSTPASSVVASVSHPPTSSSVLPNSSSSSGVIDLTPDSDEDEIDGSLLSSISPETMSQSRKMEQLDRSEIIRTTSSQSSGDIHLRFNLSDITGRWTILRGKLIQAQRKLSRTNSKNSTASAAGVAEPAADSDNAAEATLSRVIEKSDFSKMDVLGQFNLGFIIVRKRGQGTYGGSAGEVDLQDDLFIVDQHAADEKYNFETLQETCSIKSQQLFRPLPLDLTATDEILAIENMDVLRRNGFEIHIRDDVDGSGDLPAEDFDMEASQTRLSLSALPISKGTVFDLKDLEEVLHLLHENPSGQVVRCSKARAMFASRACRKSVMVGMPLTKAHMTTVIHHMGKMDEPWNCPHGRPTMRHLYDMSAKTPMKFKEVDWASFT